MGLYIDKQSLDDLVIFANRGKDSVFGIFNKAHTTGGAELMEEWFRYPLSDPLSIKKRVSIISYFAQHHIQFPFQSAWFDQANFYLDMADERSRLNEKEPVIKRKFQAMIGADTEYQKIVAGVKACSYIIFALRQLIRTAEDADHVYGQELVETKAKIQGSALADFPDITEPIKMTHADIVRLDNLLRFAEKETFMGLLRDIYTLDVYLTAAHVANERQFSFPEVDDSDNEVLRYDSVFHPLVPRAKGNDLALTKKQNVVFLTGANMAGKSTFMKSIGIALYLAHIGFPVPAKGLVFSPREAIYTSINLPDNINMGYSHFYAEVLRIRRVAEQLAEHKKLFVIFDEMFRGTNVKDAYEATLEIVSRIYENPYCQFIISTHIIEAGEYLQQTCPHINFVYLPTKLVDNIPVYTYRLDQGITADRHGMVIVDNEGIVDLLKRAKK